MKNIFFTPFPILLTATLIFFFSECSKNNSPTHFGSNSTDTTFIGSWNWVKSIGGYSGSTITPETGGYRQKIILNPDSTFETYRNDTLYAKTKYYICKEKLCANCDTVCVIHYEDSIRFRQQTIILIGYDELNLSDQCVDCYQSYYERIK